GNGSAATGARGCVASNVETIIDRCTFSNNQGVITGGVFIASVGLTATKATITNSTFSGNTGIGGFSQGGGGGIAVMNYSKTSGIGPVLIQNCTISGNSSGGSGGGISVAGVFAGIANPSPLTIQNCTIASNTAAGTGGGLFVNNTTSTVNIDSTIIGNNTAATHPDMFNNATPPSAAPAVAKFSLFQSTTGIKFDPTSASNVTGVDPQLQPFGNNGGPTQTRRLFVNSPAVNTGSNPVPLANDQRGATFARVVGGQADIGAYEIQN